MNLTSLTPSDPDRIGPFALRARLGAGGMGVVYLGVSVAGERVAVKVIRSGVLDDDQARARFAREVEALKIVFGPRVSSLVDADPEAEEPWLAVEYVPGRTLKQHVAEHGPLPPELVAILGAALAEGLASIHKAGLLHRDLKPHNIMLGPDGPIVIDFGLATLVERKQALTQTGMLIGTLLCMPPEQARGEKDLTAAADVYALGATLLYAATGHYPYDAANPLALLQRITDANHPPLLQDAPIQLAPLLAEMLSHDPEDRPALDELTERLVHLVAEYGLTAEQARRRLIAATAVKGDPTDDLVAADPAPDTREIPDDSVSTPAPDPLTAPITDAAGSGESRSGSPKPAPPAAARVAERLRMAYAREATF
ncbi:Serine/threonine protein kinase [Carbonactinospora thermoautotrophica]|uniref:Serine/threonine protein kinase n=1 Tax=Carbonactinospora thermoautotrophica TaxID=1469144 RepID=A0A132MUP0_9ACTN|nr:serine/threonine-protein kinase [Carbonactinospora thermoautotrophica]KWX01082.1 Serine/threonine protein kinase [Carbonactinospora thermoautotrophica]